MKRSLTIAQTVAGIGHEASGPSYSVPKLAEVVAARGHQVSLHVLQWGPTPSVPGVAVRTYPVLPPRRLGLSPQMAFGLRRAADASDLLHNHGLWMASNVAAGVATWGTAAKLVMSPRGVFAPAALRRSGTAKRIMWWMGQGAAVRAADLLHATSVSEAADIRAAGLRAPLAVIPNGMHVSTQRAFVGPPLPRPELLYLGRIHPIKGLDILLQAWARVATQVPTWTLRLVGPDADGYEADLRALARRLALESRVQFDGPAYGSEKFAAYARAEAYVLPSLTENFGMSAAEALATGLPAIVSTGAPWRGLEEHGAGYWVRPDVEPLADALLRMLTLERAERRAMGERGRAWVRREFDWSSIAERWELTYEWLLSGGTCPAWVER